MDHMIGRYIAIHPCDLGGAVINTYSLNIIFHIYI